MACWDAVRSAADRYCHVQAAKHPRQRWYVLDCTGRLRGWLRIVSEYERDGIVYSGTRYYVGLSSGGVYEARGQTYGNRITSIFLLEAKGAA